MEQDRDRRLRCPDLAQAEGLARSGRFSEALHSLLGRSPTPPGNLTTHELVLLAEVLENTGAQGDARRIAQLQLQDPNLERSLRSRCHKVLGSAFRDEGRLSEAEGELLRAVALAEESGDRQAKYLGPACPPSYSGRKSRPPRCRRPLGRGEERGLWPGRSSCHRGPSPRTGSAGNEAGSSRRRITAHSARTDGVVEARESVARGARRD